MRLMTTLLVAVLVLPVGVTAQERAVQGSGPSEIDSRLARAETMVQIGNAGFGAIAVLALAGESGKYSDSTWMRVGTAASVGAIVTGFIGRKLRRDANRDRDSLPRKSLAVTPLVGGGGGVIGSYSLQW